MLSYLCIVMQSPSSWSLCSMYWLRCIVLARESDYLCVGRKTCIVLVEDVLILNSQPIRYQGTRSGSGHCLGTCPIRTSMPQETFCSLCPLPFVLHIIIRISG